MKLCLCGSERFATHCGFFTLELSAAECFDAWCLTLLEGSMSKMYMWKKVALALVLVVTTLSLGGCFVGKGKGKGPAPISTRG